MAKPKNRRKLIIFSAIGLVLVTLILLAIFKKREPVITVQTEKVARHSLTNIVVANGKIQPVVQVTISPEVSGEIIELPVKEGQQVKKDDLLVKINPDIYIAAVNQAKANYESSLAAKASAEANLEKAQADYDRNVELFHQKLLSESDFIGFKSARNVARAQLDSADDQVNVAKAIVDSAEEQLSRTTIVSPLDGTISKLNSQLGERVLGTVQNAGTIIMIISDLNADGGPRGRWRNGRGGHQARPEGAAGGGRVQGPQIFRHGDGCRQFIEGQQPDRQLFQQQQQPVAGSHQVPGAHPAQRQGRLPPRHVRQRRH